MSQKKYTKTVLYESKGQLYKGVVVFCPQEILRNGVLVAWVGKKQVYQKSLEIDERVIGWVIEAERIVMETLMILAEQSSLPPDHELLMERGYTHD